MPQTIVPNPLDCVACPTCGWHGQVVACWCAMGDVPRCPICRGPVEFECDAPAIIVGDGESNPMADTH